MSRSKRKPYYKDKGMTTQEYWGSIRRIWKQQIKNPKFWDEDFNFKLPKEIHNDYNYSDYWFFVFVDKEKDNGIRIFRGWTKKDVEKYSRK
jgi:hypothetical protein